MRDTGQAFLHNPPLPLTGCVHMAVERDTRGCALGHSARHNHFPASPLPTVSWVFHGQLFQVRPGDDQQMNSDALVPLDALTIAGAQFRASTSWSEGDVHAMTVAFYPEALQQLLNVDLKTLRGRVLPARQVLSKACFDELSGVKSFEQLARILQPRWRAVCASRSNASLSDWLMAITARATQTGTGRGMRQIQRRIKAWTGLSQRDIDQFASVEASFVMASNQMAADGRRLSLIAADAGYSDQSHLGRSVKRVTGLSPVEFESRVNNDPSFWVYRLLRDHHLA